MQTQGPVEARSLKRTLYATTALCALTVIGGKAAHADGIELGISGFMNTLFSAGGINATAGRDPVDGGAPDPKPDYNPTGLFADGEVWFLGDYKHDNGMRFGARVEMEVFSSSTSEDTISQHFIFVQSDYGRVEAGSRYSAAYQMHYAAPQVGLPINSGWVTVFIPANPDSTVAFVTPSVSTFIDYGDKENQLTYYTPRIGGFQLGLSYAPSISFSGDGKNFPVEADRDTEYSNGFSVGLNYVEEFDGLGVALSGGYRRSEAPEAVTAAGGDDYQGVSLGAELAYAGVTIGGSYANSFDGQATVDGGVLINSTEGQAWDVGVAYSSGPWVIGAAYLQTEVEGAPGGTAGFVGSGNEDKLYAATAGIDYELGPGINAIGGVMYGRWSAESGAVNTGVIGAAGLTLSF
ncbi:MAG: porin [Kiloniellales bacterium]